MIENPSLFIKGKGLPMRYSYVDDISTIHIFKYY